jgi:hypothetical protein
MVRPTGSTGVATITPIAAALFPLHYDVFAELEAWRTADKYDVERKWLLESADRLIHCILWFGPSDGPNIAIGNKSAQVAVYQALKLFEEMHSDG